MLLSRAKRGCVVFAVFAMTLASGCGYTVQHRLKDSFLNPKGIFVPVFDNQTNEIGAERTFSNALIRELVSRREVLLANRQNGGLELRGTVVAIDVAPSALTDKGFRGLPPYRRMPSELGVRVSLSLKLIQMSDEKVLWTKDFNGFRRVNTPINRTFDYEAPSAAGVLTQSLVESVYAEIARDIMRDVYDEMVELF